MQEEAIGEPGTARGAQPAAELARALAEALSAADHARVRSLVAGLEAPDLADLIELLEPAQRVPLIEALGAAFVPRCCPSSTPRCATSCCRRCPRTCWPRPSPSSRPTMPPICWKASSLQVRQEILARIPTGERAALERNLEYPQETAGRLMQTDFVAVPPFWTVGQVIDHMREAEDLPETFSDIYVVDPTYHVLGSVDLSRLLRTKRQVAVDTIMDPTRHVVLATADQEEMARQFERYDLKSAPVVDANKRLVGVVTVDDVVEVIEEEAEEDILRLGGVGDESVADNVFNIVRNRFSWLFINLGTALLSASVIKLFDATIEQMVALAVLMPIVASMGGNAATQTMTVTVRALATRELGAVNTAPGHRPRGLRRPHQRAGLCRHHGLGGAALVRRRQAGPGDRRGHDLQLSWRPRWPASSSP